MRYWKTLLAIAVSAAAFAASGRDMLISNGRLVNAMNAGGNMITNLPPEFWEGHGGSGANTNVVNDLVAIYVTTNAATTNLTARIASCVKTNGTNYLDGYYYLGINNVNSRLWFGGGSYIDPNEQKIQSAWLSSTSCGSMQLEVFDGGTLSIPESANVLVLGNRSMSDYGITNETSGAGITAIVATNIAASVTSNVVTKAYVEWLGISGGGVNTNVVNDLAATYFATNQTDIYIRNGGSTKQNADIYVSTVKAESCISVNAGGSLNLWGGWDSLCNRLGVNQTLPQYVSSAEVTNAGAVAEAKAYANATFAPISAVQSLEMKRDKMDFDVYTNGTWRWWSDSPYYARKEYEFSYAPNIVCSYYIPEYIDGHWELMSESMSIGGIAIPNVTDSNATEIVGTLTEYEPPYNQYVLKYYRQLEKSGDTIAKTSQIPAYFSANADYALTNIAENATNAVLASGMIANLTTTGGPLAVTLALPSDNYRSCDALLRLVNSADVALGITTNSNVTLDGAWPSTIKAGTNLVMFTKTAYANGKSIITATSKEIK